MSEPDWDAGTENRYEEHLDRFARWDRDEDEVAGMDKSPDPETLKPAPENERKAA